MTGATEKRKLFSVAIKSDAYQKLINSTLGDKAVAQKFVAEISSVVSQNPALQKCEPGSILSAGLLAQTLRLPLASSLGFAYIVPYKDKAQFQVGYKGFVQLAMRSEKIVAIDVKEVHEGEYKGMDEDGEDIVEFAGHKYDDKPVVGYRAYFKTTNGFKKSLYRTVGQIKAHGRRYSRTFGNPDGLWAKNFDMMAKKTVLKEMLSKWAPLSVEMETAVKADQAAIRNDGSYDYVDNPEGNEADVSPTRTTVVNTIAPDPEPKAEPETGEGKGELPFEDVPAAPEEEDAGPKAG